MNHINESREVLLRAGALLASLTMLATATWPGFYRAGLADGAPDAGLVKRPNTGYKQSVRHGVDYMNIAQHPVFEPSRQPWFPPSLPTKSGAIVPVAQPIGYVLSGLALSSTQHEAILRGPAGETIVTHEGDHIGDWTIQRIDTAGIHLVNAAHRFEISMSSLSGTVAGMWHRRQ